MTQPDPTPGAPETAPPIDPVLTRTYLPAPTPPQQPAEPDKPVPPWERDGQPFNPERAWKLIQDLKGENTRLKDPTSARALRQAAEAEARQNALAEVARALGLEDEEPDPAELQQRIVEARDSAWRSGVHLAIYQGAAAHGADPAKLLDSLTFLQSLDDLVEDDATSEEFRAALSQRIADAVARNPHYKTGQAPASPGQAPGPRPDPSQGAKAPTPPPRPTSLHAAIDGYYRPKA